jgi:anti-anti-sigma factor
VRIEREARGTETRVAVAGEIDLATAAEVGAAVRFALRDGPVVLDLGEVTFMDSSGVRLIDALLRDCAREGWELRFARTLTDQVTQVLELTEMMGELPFEDEEETR